MKAAEQISELLGIPSSVVESTLAAHAGDVARINRMHDYYEGNHAILSRSLPQGMPNNQVVSNHAKYITTMLTGYFIGNPPMYVASAVPAEEAVDFVNSLYRKRHVGVHDYMMGKETSVSGLSYELIYIPSAGEPDEEYNVVLPKMAKLDPRFTMVFQDIDIEQTIRGAMYFIPLGDDEFQVWVYTDAEVYVYTTDDPYEGEYELYSFPPREGEVTPSNPAQHLFGGAPIIRYDNNEISQGDFEQVISLIDAYNLLQSDRLNDTEQLVDAVLLITGGTMPNGGMGKLMEERILSLPDPEMKASWLTKNLSDSAVDNLTDNLKKDIHEFSFTPNLTDENFAGTTSGEAMKFKLFGTEQVLQEKEVYFERGLRLRLKRIFTYLSSGGSEYDSSQVKIEFNHAMPTNLPDPVTIVNQLYGKVSLETLLTLLDFVEDVPGELQKLKTEQEAEAALLKSTMEYPGAGKIEEDIDVEEPFTE